MGGRGHLAEAVTPIYVNDGGTAREIREVRTKVGAAAGLLSEVYVNDGGTPRRVWAARDQTAPPPDITPPADPGDETLLTTPIRAAGDGASTVSQAHANSAARTASEAAFEVERASFGDDYRSHTGPSTSVTPGTPTTDPVTGEAVGNGFGTGSTRDAARAAAASIALAVARSNVPDGAAEGTPSAPVYSGETDPAIPEWTSTADVSVPWSLSAPSRSVMRRTGYGPIDGLLRQEAIDGARSRALAEARAMLPPGSVETGYAFSGEVVAPWLHFGSTATLKRRGRHPESQGTATGVAAITIGDRETSGTFDVDDFPADARNAVVTAGDRARTRLPPGARIRQSRETVTLGWSNIVNLPNNRRRYVGLYVQAVVRLDWLTNAVTLTYTASARRSVRQTEGRRETLRDAQQAAVTAAAEAVDAIIRAAGAAPQGEYFDISYSQNTTLTWAWSAIATCTVTYTSAQPETGVATGSGSGKGSTRAAARAASSAAALAVARSPNAGGMPIPGGATEGAPTYSYTDAAPEPGVYGSRARITIPWTITGQTTWRASAVSTGTVTHAI